jgi:hypothetical protein
MLHLKLTWDQMDKAEDAVISSVLATVLRLPESAFRTVKFPKVGSLQLSCSDSCQCMSFLCANCQGMICL